MTDRLQGGQPEKPPAPCEEKKFKTPYVKPSFEYERVFETMALACGKISPVQAQCKFNRKNS